MGLKCAECGSYNTSREKGEGAAEAAAPIQEQNNADGEDDEWTTDEEEEIVGGEEGAPGNEAEGKGPVAEQGDDLHEVGELVGALDLEQVELNVEFHEGEDLPID